MKDIRIENLANIIVNYSLEVKSEEWIVIYGDVVALPLINEIARYILRAGGQFTITLISDEIKEIILKESSDKQLKWLSPSEDFYHNHMDAFVIVNSSGNTRALSGVNKKKQSIRKLTQGKLMNKRMDRTAKGEMRWVGVEYPSAAYAQDAEMSLSDYEDFVYKATYADQANGIEMCKQVYERDDYWADIITGHKKVKLKGPNVDMSLSIEGRKFINSAGKFNVPDGEIYTSPVEDSVNGWIKFSYPIIYDSHEFDGVEFHFKNGEIIKAKADKNEEYLLEVLNTVPGSRYLGEFAIATNYQIKQGTKRILYDEKIGGTIHLAIGNSYPSTGGKNISGVHWDFVCDMNNGGEIFIDDVLIHKNGNFLKDHNLKKL